MIDENLDSKFDGEMPKNEKSDKWHDTLRLLQWLIPDLFAFFGVLDKVFGWGYADTISIIVSALVGLLGNIAQHSSKTFFRTKSIVDKVVPDTEEL